MTQTFLIAALTASTFVAAISPAGAAANPLAPYRWTHRVLLVSAPSADDPQLLEQKTMFRAMQKGAAERDLALVEAVGDGAKARALRAAAEVDGAGFRVLLIGKDGGTKMSSETPLGPDVLFPTIDAMPMRRDEAARQP
ncbi:DUF4174 domain-containing protein [Lichenihabitans psoromatis]|uniref:DUF4174 domain-containing protein n=1 Tax=Lichenihabitans psoromatis TaxID=2528642 RepID=UPI001035ABB5|nr:DUF4174 domain-containing protein [Lichenihabitans psoromatis]